MNALYFEYFSDDVWLDWRAIDELDLTFEKAEVMFLFLKMMTTRPPPAHNTTQNAKSSPTSGKNDVGIWGRDAD